MFFSIFVRILCVWCLQVQFGCKPGRDEAGAARLSALTGTLGKGIPQLPKSKSHQPQNVCTHKRMSVNQT